MAKNDRLRVPIDARCLSALGLAAYAFAGLEWNAVWCCERMQPGYIYTVNRKTAGTIAREFVALAEENHAVRDVCLGPAKEFRELVKIRNGILHGKPGTAPDGAQRLFRDAEAWTPEMLDDAADKFTACSIMLSALLYNQLK